VIWPFRGFGVIGRAYLGELPVMMLLGYPLDLSTVSTSGVRSSADDLGSVLRFIGWTVLVLWNPHSAIKFEVRARWRVRPNRGCFFYCCVHNARMSVLKGSVLKRSGLQTRPSLRWFADLIWFQLVLCVRSRLRSSCYPLYRLYDTMCPVREGISK
jgi:hypothetical protein